MRFKQFNHLTEGINDKYPLKALFIIGVASSGKSTLSTPMKFYAKHIDVDYPQEYFSDKYDLDLGKDADALGKRRVREIGKRITTDELISYVEGMLPMVVNVVGDDIERTKARIKILRDFGYDVGMIYINADIEDALKRVVARRYGKNKDRHRHIAPEHVYDSYRKLIVNAKKYQDMLFDRAESNQELLDFFMQIQNNGFIDDSTVSRIHKEAKKFFEAPIQNEKGVKILQQLKDTKKKMLTDLISKSDIIDRFSKWF
jgi:hypothetical protein